MKLCLNKAHYPVTVLGPGRRIGLWLQGCSIQCPGCMSRDTWPFDEHRAISVEAIVEWCRHVAQDQIDGITISGGEPFDQPEGLSDLLDRLDAWRRTLPSPLDLLAYSGYPMARLRRRHADILARLDAVIPEPFVKSQPTDGKWLGSANQRIVVLSALGRARYSGGGDTASTPGVQLHVESGRVWLVGIPQRGELQHLESRCRENGISLKQASWRA
jgi:anaerobic ribonucleoside-triphosphate reductase activating protein